VVGHEIGTGGAIQAYPYQVPVGQGGVEGLGVLTGQEGPHGLHGALDRYGYILPNFDGSLGDTVQAGLDVYRVLAGFQEEEIRATFDKPKGLLAVGLGQVFEIDPSSDGDRLGGGAH